jgi:hypothetical protein
MSNFVYNKAKEKFLGKLLDWGVGPLGDTFKAVLLTNAYTPSVNHTSLSDVPVAARIGTSAALIGKNLTNGVASANPASFTGLPTSVGANIRYIVIIKQNTGDTDAQSFLIAFMDTATGITTGLPVTQSIATIEWALDSESGLASPNNRRLIFSI